MLTLLALRDSLNSLTNILLVKKASEPPFKITGLPDLKQRQDRSTVTLGLLS